MGFDNIIHHNFNSLSYQAYRGERRTIINILNGLNQKRNRRNIEDRYLFKAKRLYNGEWVQGYLYGIWDKKYILWGMTNDIPNMVEVDPSTICQCTGLKDKNGNLIWENDDIKL